MSTSLFTYIQPGEMTARQLALLDESRQVPAPVNQFTLQEMLDRLEARRWHAFACKQGLFVVEVLEGNGQRRMVVVALALPGFGWFMRRFRDEMDRLAAAWMCDTVETLCFDKRIADATLKIEGQVEAYSIVWQVKGTSDGQ